jgi:RimJ/RimL family protein N-acetyltransferase
MKFHQYLLYYADELYFSRQEKKCQFAIETSDGEHIGNCAYYGIDDKKGEAEIGVMIGKRDYWEKGYGADAVTALADHIFLNTHLKRIYLKTLETNGRAQRCFSRCGFSECGRLVDNGYRFVVMELHRRDWCKRNEDR